MEVVAEKIATKIVAPLLLEATNHLTQSVLGFEKIPRKVDLELDAINFIRNHSGDKVEDEMYESLTNLYVYNPIKFLGPFMLVESKATFNYDDPHTGVTIKKGSNYLTIHLVPEKGDEVTTKKIHEGLRRVGEYISMHKRELPPGPVIGITYEQLASASRRFGFTLAQTPLPDRIRDGFIKYSGESQQRNYNRQISNVSLCFQSYESLIKKGSSPD